MKTSESCAVSLLPENHISQSPNLYKSRRGRGRVVDKSLSRLVDYYCRRVGSIRMQIHRAI